MAVESPWKKWGALLVLSLALAIIVIDTTLLNVSLATIIKDFNTDVKGIQWVITAYSLVLAAFTITGGRLGDFFGRKRMFMLGAVIFAIGSYIASISNNVPTMIWGESIIEGIGAALMMPATASLLVSSFQGRERAIAFGVWGGVAAAASAVGPILGGWLTTHYSWRWGFRINILVVLMLLIGSVLIHEARDTKEKPNLDFVGVLLSVVGLVGVVFGIIEAETYGWWKAKEAFVAFGHSFNGWGGLSITPYSIIVGLIFIGLFMAWQSYLERNKRTPLVSLKLFKNKQFTVGSIVSAIISLGMAGSIFVIPVFLQAVRNLDAYNTGLALLPMSVIILIAAPLSAVLSNKIGPKPIILTGLFLNSMGALYLRHLLHIDATATTLMPALILFGLGMGMVMAQISNVTLSAVSVQEAGEASGVTNTFRQLGSTLGSAIIGAVMLTALATNLSNGISDSQIIPAPAKAQISSALSGDSSSVEFGGAPAMGANVPDQIVNEITHIAHQATVDADRLALVYAATFSLLGVLVAAFLPKIKPSEHGHSQPKAAH